MADTDNSAKKTRSTGLIAIDLETEYPLFNRFDKSKLPTYKEVLGLYRTTFKEKTKDNSINEVANILWNHWTDRNVYPVTMRSVKNRVKKLVDEYTNVKKKQSTRSKTKSWKDKAEILINNKDKLFDIFCEDNDTRARLEKQHQIPMLEEDFKYLTSMRSDRKAISESKTDKIWHDKENKRIESHKHYIQTQSSNISTAVYFEDNESSDGENTEEQYLPEAEGSDSSIRTRVEIQNTPGRKKSKYIAIVDNEDDILPYHLRHIRQSERIVRDEVYSTMAKLEGEGFSYNECQKAIMVVGNTLFGRKWKIPLEENGDDDDQESSFDADTLPTVKNIREMSKKIGVQAIKLVGNRVMEAKAEGATITHATDSTTRKVVGTFAPQGIHINKGEYLALPTLPLSSESTNNLAELIKVDFQILEAASGHSAESLYKAVDVHMTDATAHNKGISTALARTFNREIEAGQIFCDSHTALGFDRSMSKVVKSIEETMGMQVIFNSFLLDVEADIDQRKDTVAIQTVDWSLRLFGPDCSQKSWNYYRDFSTFMKRQGKAVHLFSLKDARFGAQSRASAIMCYHWEDFLSFLESHAYITNKLACLVRDAMTLDYIKVVIAVVAALGVHIVSPYHAMTIDKAATHSSLKEFFNNLYSDLVSHQVGEDFFKFEVPEFHAVSARLFDRVKVEYKIIVLNSVMDIAKSHIEDCITLTNKMIPQLGDMLASQRGRYYDFGEYPREYFVFDQCDNIDNTPVHNLEMERQCGDTDHRLKKKSSLDVVARGTMLKQTSHLLASVPPGEFRKMGPVVQKLKEIKDQWIARQKELQSIGLNKKEANLLQVENRKLNILDKLKKQGGPFTSSKDVQTYLGSTQDLPKMKLNRMKDEVTYARDTCSSLPRANPIFRIFKTEGRKRTLLTPEEYGKNLQILFGKTQQRSTITLDDFREALAS